MEKTYPRGERGWGRNVPPQVFMGIPTRKLFCRGDDDGELFPTGNSPLSYLLGVAYKSFLDAAYFIEQYRGRSVMSCL